MWLLFAVGSAFFAGGDFYPGKMRDTEDGFNSGYRCADSGDPGLFLDHGIFCRILGSAFFRKGQYSGFF